MIADQKKDLPAPVVTALSQGQKLEAIRLLREAKGIGLKEAKDMVDAYTTSRPEPSRRLSAMQEEGKMSLLRWIVLLAVLALAAYWLFTIK